MWYDFHADVEASVAQSAPLTEALLALFRHYGFEPPSPEIGDLKHLDKAIADKNRRNFAKLWATIKGELRGMGWRRMSPGAIAELYVDEGRSKRVKKAWLDATWAPGLLRIRLTPHTGQGTGLHEALLAAKLPHQDQVGIARSRAAARIRDQYAEVSIARRTLFGDAKEAPAMERVLADFVTKVFRAAG